MLFAFLSQVIKFNDFYEQRTAFLQLYPAKTVGLAFAAMTAAEQILADMILRRTVIHIPEYPYNIIS
jgi:hypothetical protein